MFFFIFPPDPDLDFCGVLGEVFIRFNPNVWEITPHISLESDEDVRNLPSLNLVTDF